MPATFVTDPGLGASIAEAFTGGGASAGAIAAVDAARSRRQQLELERLKMIEQQRVDDAAIAAQQANAEKDRAAVAASQAAQAQRAGLGADLGEEYARTYGSLSPAGAEQLTAPSRNYLLTPQPLDQASPTADAIASTVDPRVQSRLDLADRTAREEAAVTLGAIQSGEDARKAIAGLRGNWGVQNIDPNANPDAFRRALYQTGDTGAFDPKRAFTEKQRVQMRQQELQDAITQKQAEAEATAGAKLRNEPLVIDPTKNTYLPKNVTDTVPGAPQTTSAAPDTTKIDEFRKEVQATPAYKNYAAAAIPASTIEGLVVKAAQRGQDQPWTAAEDMALISSYAKLLDPNSVVREGEYKVASQQQGVQDQIQGYLDQLRGEGQLQPEARQRMLAAASQVFGSYRRGLQSEIDMRRETGKARGYNERDWVPTMRPGMLSAVPAPDHIAIGQDGSAMVYDDASGAWRPI